MNKADLLGKVSPRKHSEDTLLDPEAFHEGFEDSSSVAFAFCTGCGALYELDGPGKECFEREAGMAIVPEGYFAIDGCPVCDVEVTKVEVKRIQSH